MPALEKNSYTSLSFAFKQIFIIECQENKSDLMENIVYKKFKAKCTNIMPMANVFDYLVSKYSPLIPFRISLWFSHFLLFLFISSARE